MTSPVPSGRIASSDGCYKFTQSRDLDTLSPARPVSGTLQLTAGGCYGYPLRAITWRGRAEFGPRFLMEPAISLNYFDTPYGNGDRHLVRSLGPRHLVIPPRLRCAEMEGTMALQSGPWI